MSRNSKNSLSGSDYALSEDDISSYTSSLGTKPRAKDKEETCEVYSTKKKTKRHQSLSCLERTRAAESTRLLPRLLSQPRRSSDRLWDKELERRQLERLSQTPNRVKSDSPTSTITLVHRKSDEMSDTSHHNAPTSARKCLSSPRRHTNQDDMHGSDLLGIGPHSPEPTL